MRGLEIPADTLAEFQSAHAVQGDVREDEVRLLLAEQFQRPFGGRGGEYAVFALQLAFQVGREIGVVLHDEQRRKSRLLRTAFGCGRRLLPVGGLRRGAAQGQREDEVGALRAVVEDERSAVQFGEGAGQRKPDADAFGVVAVLHEGFEYPAAVLLRDDRAVVADRDHGIAALAAGFDLDIRFGVFQGVVQQVVEDLVQSRFVGQDGELFLLVAERQPEVVALGRLREVEAEEADLLDQVEVAAVEHVAVALDLHEVQQLLHQLRQVFGVVVDDHQVLADLAAALPGGEDVL